MGPGGLCTYVLAENVHGTCMVNIIQTWDPMGYSDGLFYISITILPILITEYHL